MIPWSPKERVHQPCCPSKGDCSAGLHVAIIMDGSGRWALARGRSRPEGHRAGADAVRRVIDTAPGLGIITLTLFAFSADNWQRPATEVQGLMQVFQDYLETATETAAERGVRISGIGRRDRLPAALLVALNAAESASRGGTLLHLRLAIDYSGRDAILRTARRLGQSSEASPETFSHLLALEQGDSALVPDVDLLIRTGGEQRLSDCPLWEIAYAELLFTNVLWPDFQAVDLAAAVREFHSRERRFGRVPEPADLNRSGGPSDMGRLWSISASPTQHFTTASVEARDDD
jgi:undecaprenyl diphosphate synthase